MGLLRLAVLLLLMATMPAVASPAPSAGAAATGTQPQAPLRIAVHVGEERTQVDAIVEMSVHDQAAIDSFKRGKIGALACRRLMRVALERSPLCLWFQNRTGMYGLSQQVTVTDEKIQVAFRSAIPTKTLLFSDDDVSFAVSGNWPGAFALSVRAQAPYSILGADPLPNALGAGRAVYHVAREPGKEFSIEVRLLNGSPERSLESERPGSVLESGSSKQSRMTKLLFQTYFNFTLMMLELLLPVLLAWGLLVRLDEASPGWPANLSARRIAIALGSVCLLPLGLVTGSPLRLLLPSDTAYILGIVIDLGLNALGLTGHSMGSREIAWQLSYWILDCTAAFLAALLLSFALYLLRRLLLKAGQPVLMPQWVLPMAMFGLSVVARSIQLVMNVVDRPLPKSDMVPEELYLLIVVMLLASLFYLLARMFARLGPPSRWGPLLATVAFIAVAIPWNGFPQASSDASDSANVLLNSIAAYSAPLASVAAIILLLWLLHMRRSQPVLSAGAGLSCLAGGAIFAASLLPRTYSWSGVLAALIAFAFVWPRFALCGGEAVQVRARHLLMVTGNLAQWIERLEQAAALKSATRRTGLDAKLSAGELTPHAWRLKRKVLEESRDRAIEAVLLPGGGHARDIVLGTSIERDPWRSGLRAAAYGAPIVFLLTAIRIFQAESWTPAPPPLLAWLTNNLPPAAKMAAATFLFGYFFDRLKGGTGLHKALYLGAAFCLAEVVIWIPRLTESTALAGMAWTFSQHFLLLIPIGVLAFDYARMREVEGRGFDWRRFSWFGDPRLLSTGIAASLAALGPTVATLFSGTFASAVREVATVVAPTLTGK